VVSLVWTEVEGGKGEGGRGKGRREAEKGMGRYSGLASVLGSPRLLGRRSFRLCLWICCSESIEKD
jgi:hypothetical protein